MPKEPSAREPIINAPLPLTVLGVLMIALHGARVFSPKMMQMEALMMGALAPDRFWAWVNQGPPGYAYDGILSAIAPLFLSAFLHGDWMHVILNALFLIAVGKPVLGAIISLRGSYDGGAVMTFLLLFFLSQAVGGLFFLVMHYPVGPIAIGASAGVSGLMGAFILMRDGASARLLSRNFLSATGVFVFANILLAFMGPVLLGSSIAWEAHLGGYIGGAIFSRVLIWMALRRMGPLH